MIEASSRWVAIKYPADASCCPGTVSVVGHHSVVDILRFLGQHHILDGGEDLEPVQLVN